MASFVTVVLNAASVCSENVKYADCVQQYFWRENNKELTVHCVLEWSALLLLDQDSPRRCCLWNEVKTIIFVPQLRHKT